MKWVLVILLVASVLCFSLTLGSTNKSDSCPMDLNYVLTIPWNASQCHGSNFENDSKSSCCQTLLSLYGIGLAQHLKETSLFWLPDLPTSVSCLSDFQSKLDSLSLAPNLPSICFDPLQFVNNPSSCAGIRSTKDWFAKVGTNSSVDQACKADLSDLTSCNSCFTAGTRVRNRLVSIDGNTSHATNCFYFTDRKSVV